MTSKAQATSVEGFLQRVAEEHGRLSRQLKAIAEYVEQNRDHVALDRIQDIARRCGVQPSAVVRFAQHFGFTGFTDMQALFKAKFAAQIAPTRSYQQRIRAALESGELLDNVTIAREFVGGAVASLEELDRSLNDLPLDVAIAHLQKANAVWVVGARRAFPVAAYLAYTFQHANIPVHLVDFVGAMHSGQIKGVKKGDVVIAISFAPYAEETLGLVREALETGASVIAITDSRVSSLAQVATTVLVVRESSLFGFRSLSSTMALAQSLFVILAYRLELEGKFNSKFQW